MKQGLIEINWSLAGATLAQSGADEQAEFLKAFIKECSTWGTHFQVEQQLAAVNRLLTDEEKEVLEMLSYKEKK